jgi:23S rRNA (cytosine1962-C5)-methyltransferase
MYRSAFMKKSQETTKSQNSKFERTDPDSANSTNSASRGGSEAVLTTRGVARVRSGHLWIYRSDLGQRPAVESGEVVRVVDQRGRFLAWAHFGAESEITLRILSHYPEAVIDREFWRNRLKQALELRTRIVRDSDCFRIVHGDGDALPGLVVDRYGEALVIQTLTRGMDRLKGLWIELLVELLQPRLIIERNDARVRQLEGLPMINSILFQTGPTGDEPPSTDIVVTENGLRFVVDMMSGQKTGAFLDQRENRAVAREIGRGNGLDCFSFHGSFALHLAAGCDHVTALDVSLPAIERARHNAELNGVSNVEFIETNVFDQLRDYDDAGRRFETIVLDPPAFAKNRGALEGALRGYKEINLRAMRLLSPGGVLITCTCSYHVSETLFLEILGDAARDAGRVMQVLEKRTQGRDHPMLLSVPETYYLKCFILRLVD